MTFNAIRENKILPKISEFTVYSILNTLFYFYTVFHYDYFQGPSLKGVKDIEETHLDFHLKVSSLPESAILSWTGICPVHLSDLLFLVYNGRPV